MTKYTAVAKILFKAQIVYRFDVALTAIATVWRVLFAFILWGAVYTERDTVGGLSLQAMLSYYVVSSFLASLEMSNGVCSEVSSRIRGGSFSKYMVIPANPQLHFIAQGFGTSGYYAIFSILAAVLCAFLFQIHVTLSADLLTIICALLMVPVGLAFMISYQFFIGVLTFKFQDTGGFIHLQGAILSFLTGTIIPLTLLPHAAQQLLRFIPFTYVTYMPSMLLTGQADIQDGLFGLAVLIIWAAFMFMISQFTYNRLRIKFDGVGI